MILLPGLVRHYFDELLPLPQMVSLYRDPEGKKIFDGMDSAAYRVSSTAQTTSISEDGKSDHLAPESNKHP